jgi:membrane protein insertase Oxa1/YidC/SpoIIIJ
MDNNNLDDFFNKKLNDFDSSGDDWDKLGKTPFDNIQPSFPKYTKATWITPMSILTGVMGVTLTALVVYTFYLKNEIHTLQQHILTENIVKETTHSNTTSSDNSLSTINENQPTNTQVVEATQSSDNKAIENNKSSINSNQDNPILNNTPKFKEGKNRWK